MLRAFSGSNAVGSGLAGVAYVWGEATGGFGVCTGASNAIAATPANHRHNSSRNTNLP